MTSHTIEVSLLDDGIFELNEVFIGNLALLSSAGIPPVRIDFAMADITIIDDDCEENFITHNYTESPAIKIMMTSAPIHSDLTILPIARPYHLCNNYINKVNFPWTIIMGIVN